jgi:hypothetical protein
MIEFIFFTSLCFLYWFYGLGMQKTKLIKELHFTIHNEPYYIEKRINIEDDKCS